MPEKLSNPTTIPDGSTALMTHSGQGEPRGRRVGLPVYRRTGPGLTNSTGLEVNNYRDKLDKLERKLNNVSFKTEDKLKRLNDIEDSISEKRTSDEVAELAR